MGWTGGGGVRKLALATLTGRQDTVLCPAAPARFPARPGRELSRNVLRATCALVSQRCRWWAGAGHDADSGEMR